MVKLSSPKSSGWGGLTPQIADGLDSASPVALQPLLPPPPHAVAIHPSLRSDWRRTAPAAWTVPDGWNAKRHSSPGSDGMTPPPPHPSLPHHQLVGVACSRPAGGTLTQQRCGSTSSTNQHETGSDLRVTFDRCSVGMSRGTLCLIQIRLVFEANWKRKGCELN